jgi:hypothetical protein
LVIALAMIMRDEIPNGGPQRFLSEQDASAGWGHAALA